MDLRPRFTDLLALVGILILLVSVPPYLAQGTPGEDLAQGWEGTLPAPRDGAVLEIEMVATWQGEEPLVVGPVWTHRVRAVDPGEVPVDATFVYEKERHPLVVDLGWGTYEADHWIEKEYYDHQGLHVWSIRETQERDGETGIGFSRTHESRGTGWPTELNKWADTPLIYHPEIGRLAMTATAKELVMEIQYGLVGGTHHQPEPIDGAHEHRGERIFRHGFDPFEVLMGEDRPCAGCHSHPFEIIPLTLHEAAKPGRILRDDGFEWLSRDWPVPVGPHMWYYDHNATDLFLEVAFVPRHIEPGSGPDYTVTPAPRGMSRAEQVRIPVEGAQPLPTTSLGALEADTRILHRGVSVPDLLEAVRGEQAPADVRAFSATARLVEFYWVDGEARDRLAPAEEGILPSGLPLDDQAAPTQIHPMAWFVTMAQDDGAYRVFRVDLEHSVEGIEVVSVATGCGRERNELHWSIWEPKCASAAEPLVAAGRTIADPIAARDHAAEAAGVAQDELPSFGFLPLAHTVREDLGRGLYTLRPIWGIYPDGARFPYLIDPAGVGIPGIGFWRTNETDDHSLATFDLADGGVYATRTERHAAAEDAPDLGEVRPETLSGAVRALNVVGTGAIGGGLILVTLSLLIRLMGWLKAGGGVALAGAFYAKIARSDVLSHERRNEIMELIRVDPGVTASDVARRMGYGWGATVHHLETLVKNGFLIPVAANGKRHYFTKDEGTRRSRAEDVARRDPAAAAFLDAVAARPGATLKELAELLSRRAPALSRLGSRLVKDGLVRKERDGMSVRFWSAHVRAATTAVTVAAEKQIAG